MSEFTIVNEYPHAPAKVWRALTDPQLIALWTTTGQGGRPVGFSTAVGTQFTYVAKPMPGWNGVVHCEVLERREGELLRYSWRGDDTDDVTMVTYRLEPHLGGSRFTWEHTGFTGFGGLLMSRLLGSVRRKMLSVGLVAVLNDLDEHGVLRPDSRLQPRPLATSVTGQSVMDRLLGRLKRIERSMSQARGFTTR